MTKMDKNFCPHRTYILVSWLIKYLRKHMLSGDKRYIEINQVNGIAMYYGGYTMWGTGRGLPL